MMTKTAYYMQMAQEAAAQWLTGLLEQYDASHPDDPSWNRDVIKAANEAESKRRQVEAVTAAEIRNMACRIFAPGRTSSLIML